MKKIIFLFSFVFFSIGVVQATDFTFIFRNTDFRIWKVYSNGDIKKTDLKNSVGQPIHSYQEFILFSKNGKNIFLSYNQSLWLYKSGNLNPKQLVCGFSEPKRNYDYADLIPIALFDNDKKLLFKINHSYDECGDESLPRYPHSSCKNSLVSIDLNNAGCYIYDLLKDKIQKSKAEINFFKKMTDGDLLLSDPASGNAISPFSILNIDGDQLIPKKISSAYKNSPDFPNLYQMDINKKHQVVFVQTYKDENDKYNGSQIFYYDPKTGDTKPISPLGKFAEYQRPVMSPSGKSIGYVHLEQINHKSQSVIVDGTEIFSEEGYVFFKWINDKTLVASTKSGLSVIDVKSRKVIAFKKIEKNRYQKN